MKSKVLLAVVISLFGFAAVAQQKKPRAAKPKTNPPATVAIVSAINAAGLKGLLSETKQRPLLVNFWATWCDPCRDEFPDLVKIDADYRPNRIDFVTVSLDEIDVIKTDVPQFLDRMKATMPSYLLNVADPEPAINAVDPKWQGDLPATFLYNVRGEVVYKHFGRVDTTELRAAIEKLISSQP
jgi:thiol-disulfide isomerase/thioredoxin